jgi:DNA modification methylase
MIITGDCLEVMAGMEASSIDTIITDPPYGLSFMGKDWDHGIPGVAFWEAALRVAKPGAFLLAFGGTRTFHRLTVAIEDAGWEIRDCMMWLYGSGFPKSHDISRAIDKAAGEDPIDIGQSTNWRESKRNREQNGQMEVRGDNAGRLTAPATDAAKEWDGWGTALKPAWEPIIVAMKPLDGTFANNALTHGVAGLNIDGARIPTTDDLNGGGYTPRNHPTAWVGSGGMHKVGASAGGEFVQPEGRWPANVILDEAAGEMLDEQSGESGSSKTTQRTTPANRAETYSGFENCSGRVNAPNTYAGSGGASRFFYCAKASRSERGEYNKHPTVKPLKLMEYLCKMTMTPTGGVVLDPFAGSGSTLLAARNVGRNFIGIEISNESCGVIKRRLEESGCNMNGDFLDDGECSADNNMSDFFV